MSAMVDAAMAETQPLRSEFPSWLRQVLVVYRKDLAIEAATGEVTVTSGFFSLLVVVLASLSFFGGPGSSRTVAAGSIWLSLSFAAVLSLGKTWQRERDDGALDGLLVAPLSRSAIFAGKALGVWTFLLAVLAVVLPVALVLFSIDADMLPPLLVIAALATPGVAATGTLFGAMTVRTGARDLLLAVVLFPLLAPTLLAAVAATRELFNGASLSELSDYFKLMGIFDVIFTVGGLGMFGTLVER
jgi:heme exporter protein B